jgi:hypothetical protein
MSIRLGFILSKCELGDISTFNLRGGGVLKHNFNQSKFLKTTYGI